ncbi:MAG: leucine zipper domain-containing protein, partial [Leptospiraceae bacterium]|nr:leucine zipper domain-containing protein [Leptospiraceae bacterium]
MAGIKYHPNAKTTVIIRKMIKESHEPISKLAQKLGVTPNTILKWKRRDILTDKSSRPHQLRTVLSPIEEWVICEVRRSTGYSLDDREDILKPFIPKANRPNIYR